jgi:transcriptional regulator with XRE-family HTH domain
MTTHDTTKRGSLRDRLAALREQHPQIAATEKELGVRLTIARNVLRLRVRGGISQRELAHRAGMSQPRIAEIEAANVNFGVDTLGRLASAFCVSVDSLLKDSDRGAVTRSVPASPMPQRTKRDEAGVDWAGRKLVRPSSAALAVAYDEQGHA